VQSPDSKGDRKTVKLLVVARHKTSMQRLTFGLIAALGLVLFPSILPAGPSAGIDASAFLDSGRLFLAAGVIFLGGLLTSLTPCVYPLIPITVGVFGARQAESKGRAFLLTAAYVVGMGIVFSSLGVFAALSGKAFGSLLGNKFVVVGLALFLSALAASMFGAFELALPSSLATKMNGVGGAGVLGALLMGSVAGFLAAPCTGPVLTGVLTWVATTRDPIVGGLLLFVYALGIGVPFFLIGVFTLRLPKGGAWMETVKSVFGIGILALALTYLRDAFPIIGRSIVAAASAMGSSPALMLSGVMAFIGVMLGAVHLSFKETLQWLPKGAGVALMLGAFLLRMEAVHVAPTGVALGVDLAQPSKAIPSTGFNWAVRVNGEKPRAGLMAALERAKADCKPVLIDFFADWCAACKELDALTYVQPEVVKESERFVTVKVDGTAGDDELDEVYAQYGIKGLPTVAFFDAQGERLDNPRINGFLPADRFLTEMKKVSSCAQRR
jgi:thioredoxin:protein disulfide reductase